MPKFIILMFLGLVALAGCGPSRQTTAIADVSRPTTITLAKLPSQGAVHGLRVSIRGKIEGEAEIQLILDGASHRTERLTGAFDVSWDTDWYGDTAEVRYFPESVRGGTVSLGYVFRD